MKTSIISMKVDVLTLDQALSHICSWIRGVILKGKYVCVSNVHMCMEVYDNSEYKAIVNEADLTVADGKPIYWAQLLKGHRNATQIRGQDLTLALCQKSQDNQFSVGFYGTTEETLEQLKRVLLSRFPNIKIVYSHSPPFRILTKDEEKEVIKNVNQSGAQILFVGLGCPKQEIWMSQHKDKLNCIMVGVGAAFDFIAGSKQDAPRWIQAVGLEWFFRMVLEPKRLWKRYLKHNPRFIWHFLLQLLGRKYI